MNGISYPETLAVILRRTSVRNYKQQALDLTDIEYLLRAAMAAPAALGRIPWKFIVIRDRVRLQDLSDGLPRAKMLSEAAAAIVVCAIPAEAFTCTVEYAVLACACASENILIAAESLGLGAVWTGVFPNPDLMAFVRDKLGIPAGVIPLNIIPVGYASVPGELKERFDPTRIHWERW